MKPAAGDLPNLVRIATVLLTLASLFAAATLVLGFMLYRVSTRPIELANLTDEQRLRLLQQAQHVAPPLYEPHLGVPRPGFYHFRPNTLYDRRHPAAGPVGVLGDVFTNPNSRTYAQGRIFNERGYTIKVATVYKFPYDFRVGIAARYQDGQHFSRLIVVPNLNQGPELIRAFRNGRTRFTFTGTLDARVQKDLVSGPRKVALLVEGYNILDMAYEIEEFQLTGPQSRTTTATQPPLSVHFGIRVEF